MACLVFSGVALWVVYNAIDPAALKKAFLNLRPGWFLGSLGLFGLCCLLAARRWHKLLKMNGCDTHPGATFRAVLIGHFFNTLLFGPAGGDIAKSAMYGRWYRYPTSEILAASFLDRLLGGGGALTFGLLAVGVALAVGALVAWARSRGTLPGWGTVA
jgi:hypothetical protein